MYEIKIKPLRKISLLRILCSKRRVVFENYDFIKTCAIAPRDSTELNISCGKIYLPTLFYSLSDFFFLPTAYSVKCQQKV